MVNECPSLSMFIPSNLKKTKLEGVYNAFSWEKERTCHWKGDLNATIEHIFKGNVCHIHTTNIPLIGEF